MRANQPMRIFTREEMQLLLRVIGSHGGDVGQARTSLYAWQRKAKRQAARTQSERDTVSKLHNQSEIQQ